MSLQQSRNRVPEALFKYVAPARIDVLTNGRLRFTQPIAFNDPFEVSPIFTSLWTPEESPRESRISNAEELLRARYDRLTAEQKRRLPFDTLLRKFEIARPYIERTANTLTNALEPWASRYVSRNLAQASSEHIGILSLAESPVQPLMWAHYTDAHQGFVIELDPRHAFFDQRKSEEDMLRHLRSVRYTKDRPTKGLKEMDLHDLFFTKSAHWDYEGEWRMLLSLETCAASLGGPPTPTCLFDIPPDAIRSVILGCRASESLANDIANLRDRDERLRHVSLRRVVLDEHQFALRVEPIPDRRRR